MTGRTGKQLLEDYPDESWRRNFIRFSDLMDVLGECLISNDYGIPDDLNAAIALTASGAAVKDRLIRKSGVLPKEAHLMCALTIGHKDLFVDIDGVDFPRLEKAIEKQLLDGDLRFPFIYGRELYDAYADLFEDEKDLLSVEETSNLLDRIPVGVFQYGRYVVGPFGLKGSLSARSVEFSGSAPAYHCSQPVCQALHPVRFSTGHDAPINAQRDKMRRLLDENKAEAAEWWSLAREITDFSEAFYGDQRSGTVIALIGDCLSEQELRALVSAVLDSTKGELRQALEGFAEVKNADDFVRSLDRSELLQISLVATEESLVSALDLLVVSGAIKIPDGEVRRSVTNARASSGAFRLRAELGHLGVRFVSNDPGFASLREQRLLKRLYVRDNDTDTEELDWQLRGFEAEDLDERLEDFFRSTDPRSALRRMILARKTNMITACQEVGIEHGDKMSDDKLVETVLWKLGFDVHVEEDPHQYFWDLHQRISALTQSSRISGIGDSETFRGVASSYFAELEGLLTDSLAFATWVLTTDHTTAQSGFSYDNEGDRLVGLFRLQEAHLQSGNDFESFDYTSEKLELYALVRGFAILATALEELETSRDGNLRPIADFPDYEGRSDLKKFLFRSTVPFLNLTDHSRRRIVEGLRKISSEMISTEVNAVRNDYSHYRRTSPEVDRMAKALEAVGSAIREIENLGIARMLCWPVGSSSDGWGRSTYRFAGPRSVEHMFARPSNFDWMGLPALAQPQYLVRGASFAEPNEVLRFTRRFESDFSKIWANYPRRRQHGPDDALRQDEVPAHPDDMEMSQ